MYDNGNFISTSLCTNSLPYSSDLAVVSAGDYARGDAANCFGAGGSYRMDISTSSMILISQNFHTSPLHFQIVGNLGADGGGTLSSREYESGSFKGFGKSICQAGNDPSVNHLIVIDNILSPSSTHSFSSNTDSDSDSVLDIQPGSLIFYMLYSASQPSSCYLESQHEAIFLAVAAALVECTGPTLVQPTPCPEFALGESQEAGCNCLPGFQGEHCCMSSSLLCTGALDVLSSLVSAVCCR